MNFDISGAWYEICYFFFNVATGINVKFFNSSLNFRDLLFSSVIVTIIITTFAHVMRGDAVADGGDDV